MKVLVVRSPRKLGSLHDRVTPREGDPRSIADLRAVACLCSRTRNVLIPAHKQALDVRSLKISAGDLMSPGGPPPYAKVVEVSFDSLNDMMAFVQSQPPDARDRMKALGTLILMYEVDEL